MEYVHCGFNKMFNLERLARFKDESEDKIKIVNYFIRELKKKQTTTKKKLQFRRHSDATYPLTNPT